MQYIRCKQKLDNNTVINTIIDSVDRRRNLFSQITQPRHRLHHLLPSKTSAHCPYSLWKDNITTTYLKLNIHSLKTVLSIVVYTCI